MAAVAAAVVSLSCFLSPAAPSADESTQQINTHSNGIVTKFRIKMLIHIHFAFLLFQAIRIFWNQEKENFLHSKIG